MATNADKICQFRPQSTPKRRATALCITFLLLSSLAGCGGQATVRKAPGLLYQTVSNHSHPLFAEVARKVSSKHAPLEVTFDPLLESSSDFRLTLDFNILDKPLHDTEFVWAISTIAMLGVYPASCARRELTLTADLYSRDGVSVKSWSIVESDTSFMWLFQGKDCSSEISAKTANKLASAMLKELYSQMSDGGVLKLADSPQPGGHPLIYVNTVNADELVERYIKQYGSYPSVSFDSDDAVDADRTLRTEFVFARSEQGLASAMGRGMGGIMTLGLVSGCKPNVIRLDAEVFGRDGTPLHQYRFSKKVRASMMDNCPLPDESSNSKQLRALLKELLRQIKADNAL